MSDDDDAVDIPATAVLDIVMQFLHEHSLPQSLHALQTESHHKYALVHSTNALTEDIINGRWHQVITLLAPLSLSTDLLMDLYEHIIFECCERREHEAARALATQSRPLQIMKTHDPIRLAHINHVMAETARANNATSVSPYGASTRDERRTQLARAVANVVRSAPPHRLLTLIAHAIQWQKHVGILAPRDTIDLLRQHFSDEVQQNVSGGDVPVTRLYRNIRTDDSSYTSALTVTPDGARVISTTSDGFIEVLDAYTGELCTDLTYQTNDAFMCHADVLITAITVSVNAVFIGTADINGLIKLWRLSSGQCVHKLTTSSTTSINSLIFNRNTTEIICGNSDGMIQMFGLVSARLLRQLSGHTAAINALIYTNNNNNNNNNNIIIKDETSQQQLVSASADGTIRFWSSQYVCITVIDYNILQQIKLSPIIGLNIVYNVYNRILVILEHSHTLILIDNNGKVQQTFTNHSKVDETLPNNNNNNNNSEFISACLSANGTYIYGLQSDGFVCTFDSLTGNLIQTLRLHENVDMIITRSVGMGIVAHPHRSILISFARDRTIKFWQP